MNEQISEQARKYADENRPGSFVKYDPEWFAFYNKKFTELLTVKCANVVWAEAEKSNNAEVNDAGYKILEIFEVDTNNDKVVYKSSYTSCDCGCNVPVANTPEKMLRFLAGRMEYAGVSDSVAAIYARDLRKILDECYSDHNNT